MNHKYYLAVILLLFCQTAPAEEYKDPNDMDQEQYHQARELSAEHENCMNEYAKSQLQKQSDVRVITDHSMKYCAPVLEKLYEKIVAWQYPPEFGSYYVSGISNRNANRLLSNLMRYAAMPRETN